MLLIILTVCLVLFIGILEYKTNNSRLNNIPVRINVNGIRGKSTVTRLIFSIIKEADRKVIGKTTGTDAKMLYWFTDQEKPIKRSKLGPNIIEQKKVVKETVEHKADTLVSECMAVRPQYQAVFQEKLFQANIGIITNVLEDHLDEMGPTLDEVADAFTSTIPFNGIIIVSPSKYTPFFRSIALKRNSTFIEADVSAVEESYLRQFPYLVFPENVALALAVAKAMNIDKQVALQGMLKSTPDAGALIVRKIGKSENPAYFFNGFSANDPQSTLTIWNRILELGYSGENSIIIMNCRRDRLERTNEFVQKVLPHFPQHTLVVIGQSTSPISRAVEQNEFQLHDYINLENKESKEIVAVLKDLVQPGQVVYGIGNIHGAAKRFVKEFEKETEVL